MRKREFINVLVAEDDTLLNDTTARQLVRLGYSVAGQVYDGLQAVELAGQERPEIVLMDLQMVDPDTGREDALAGLKAAMTIRESGASAVVLLTAHESPDLVSLASQAGVSAYLVKPARDSDLDRAISIGRARHDDLLGLRRSNAELHQQLAELQSAMSKARVLGGLISICAGCKSVRDNQGHWQPIEAFIQEHSEAKFSHGFCLECCTKLYPGILPKDWTPGSPKN